MEVSIRDAPRPWFSSFPQNFISVLNFCNYLWQNTTFQVEVILLIHRDGHKTNIKPLFCDVGLNLENHGRTGPAFEILNYWSIS